MVRILGSSLSADKNAHSRDGWRQIFVLTVLHIQKSFSTVRKEQPGE